MNAHTLLKLHIILVNVFCSNWDIGLGNCLSWIVFGEW